MPLKPLAAKLPAIQSAVRAYLLSAGWTPGQRGTALHKTDPSGSLRRFDFGRRNLREQVWEERGYSNPHRTGAWKTIYSCRWAEVTIDGPNLLRGPNKSRPLGAPLPPAEQ